MRPRIVLSAAMIINPYDIDSFTDAIAPAIAMPAAECRTAKAAARPR